MSQEVDIKLHDQQAEVFESIATEILYGGAAGGGKSHLMRCIAIFLCTLIPGIQVYLFRRLSDDLFKNHMTGPGSFPEILAPWFATGKVTFNGSKNFLRFWNGSQIWLCHCQHEKDKYKYQGPEIHVLLIDELTHFTESIYRYLRGRCRLGGLEVPAEWRDRLPLIINGSNPGGVGHTWVRRTFVKAAAAMKIIQTPEEEGGMLRQFIPAKLTDNPTLMKNDPDYLNRLGGLGSPALVEAMKNGNWDIVAGGALDDLWSDELVVPRFEVPESWPVDRSFDWGSTAPFSVGWWAEANGEEVYFPDGRTFCPPPGTLVRIAEWYGSKEIGSNQGLLLGSAEIADGIRAREKAMVSEGWIQKTPSPGPADNQIWTSTDKSSTSIADKMAKRGVRWERSDKSPGSRKNGLQLLRDRLKASITGDGPGMFFCENCSAAIDLLPVLPRSEKDPEDVDTDAEDHNYDEIRYKALSIVRKPARNIKLKHVT